MNHILRDMFIVSIPIAEKILRPILVYVFLVMLLRVFGKRELAQLNPFDLVVLLSLANTVQNAIIGEDSSVAGGFIGAFTLMLVNYVVIRFLFRHRRLDQILEGKPTVLIREGRIDHALAVVGLMKVRQSSDASGLAAAIVRGAADHLGNVLDIGVVVGAPRYVTPLHGVRAEEVRT